MQCAKVITHPYQQQLREDRLRLIKEREEEKKKKGNDATVKILSENRAAEDNLVSMIKENNELCIKHPSKYSMISNVAFHNASLLMFSKLKQPLLEAFVKVRLFPTNRTCKNILKKYGITKLPIKGKYKETEQIYQEDPSKNLIAFAYHLRNHAIKLKKE